MPTISRNVAGAILAVAFFLALLWIFNPWGGGKKEVVTPPPEKTVEKVEVAPKWLVELNADLSKLSDRLDRLEVKAVLPQSSTPSTSSAPASTASAVAVCPPTPPVVTSAPPVPLALPLATGPDVDSVTPEISETGDCDTGYDYIPATKECI